MSSCSIHKGKFANDAVCPKCKSCKHESYFEVDGVYQCNNCYKTTDKKPDKPVDHLVNGKWE